MSDHEGDAPAFEQPDFSKFAGEGDGEGNDDGGDAGEPEPGYAEDNEGNETDSGSRAAAVLEHIATSIVFEKEAVLVEERENRGQLRLSLHVAPSDMGRIIGRRGRTAQAVRTLVRAAAAADGHDAFVDIVD